MFGVLALSVAGCGGESKQPATGSGNITIVTPGEPRALNSDIDNTSMLIERLIVDDLVNTSPTTDQPLRTGLITDWKSVDDLTWEFTVRSGVRFTNGEKFDARAAAWDVKHALTSIKGATAAYVGVIKTASAPNPTTLRIKTKSVAPYLPNVLENIQALPPKYFQRLGDKKFGHAPVGTGPFLLKSWNAGQSMLLQPNPRYYERRPRIGSITFTWASEPTARANLLQTGEADIATALPITTQGNEEFNVQRVLGRFNMALEFNMHEAPFSDVRLRRAVAMSINRRQLVNAVFANGRGAKPYRNIFDPEFASAGHHGDKYITYDPEGARAILAEIGDVPAIDFYWSVGHYLNDDQVGRAIAGMLQRVGFRVNQHPLEDSAYFDLLLANKMPGMHLLGGSPTLGIEQGNLNSKYLRNSVITYCANGAIDKLAGKASTMSAGKERDALYNRIEEILISDNVCPVPLYMGVDIYGVAKRVKGFEAYSSGSWDSLVRVTAGT